MLVERIYLRKMPKIVSYWGPVAVWMAGIFYLSSHQAISASPVYWQDFTAKKFAHVTLYFGLAILVFRALKKTTDLSRPQLYFWTIIITGAYAISDEIHQSFVPTRGPSPRDVAIDIVGASLGTWVGKKLFD